MARNIVNKDTKVGIITFHNTSNYGAALQTFATISAIQQLGFDAEIIDYSNKYRNSKYSGGKRIYESIVNKKFKQAAKYLVVLPGIIIRNHEFGKFHNSFIKKSDIQYKGEKFLEKDTLKYDAVVSGSDQIWNYKNNGCDFNFLLEFVNDKVKKVAYSSSFGLIELPTELRSRYKNCLKRFDCISVREKTAVDLVKSLTGRSPFLAIDPVLLHERKFWANMSGKIEFEQDAFDFYYLNDNVHRSSDIFSLIEGSRRREKISVGAFLVSDFFDSMIHIKNHVGPQSFISYVEKARFVFTTSFHAVVFCLIFNTPFYVFMSGDKGRDSRLIQILDTFGLLDRALQRDRMPEFPNAFVDFEKFNRLWKELRDESLLFIDKALEKAT